MTDEDTKGEKPDDSNVSNWERAGRAMLAHRIALAGEEVRETFRSAETMAAEGHEIQSVQVEGMRGAVEEARRVVELVAMVCPHTEERPRWHEVVDDEVVERYVEQVEGEE